MKPEKGYAVTVPTIGASRRRQNLSNGKGRDETGLTLYAAITQ